MIRKLATHTAIYGLSSIIGRVINWLLTPYYISYYSSQDFGILSDIYGISFYFITLLTFGQETSFFYFSSSKNEMDFKQSYSSAFWSVLTFTLAFGLIFGLNFQFFASILGYEKNPMLFLLLTGIIAADTLAALPLAKIRYHENARLFATISLSNIFITLILNILFVTFFHWPIVCVFIANFIASLVRMAWAMFGNIPDMKDMNSKKLNEMLSYGSFIMIAGLLGAMNENIDRNLIPRLWKDGNDWNGKSYQALQMNGIYAACYKLGMFISLATQAFRYAVEPLFFKKSAETEDKNHLAEIFHAYLAITLAMMIGITAILPELANFKAFGLMSKPLIPKEYWVGLTLVPWILAANVCLGLYLNLSFWFKLQKKTAYGLWFSLVGALITLTINWFGIPKYGMTASAIATFLCYFCMCLLSYAYGQKIYPIPYHNNFSVLIIIFAILLLIIEVYLLNIPTMTSFLLRLMIFLIFLLGIRELWKAFLHKSEPIN